MTLRRIPVVIVGAGPTGITAATLLAQYGVETVVLDRWADVYPQPRAVHLDDEICRIVARLGIADEFAAISRPTHGLRLLDNTMAVLAEFRRDTAGSVNGFPQANMFDQPEFEVLLRNNLKRCSRATLRAGAEVTGITQNGDGSVRVMFTDRVDGQRHAVDADYVLGCDGANSVVRTEIGSHMQDLNFEQRWLVVDIATDVELDQWEGVHQVCDPARAATYMRIGDARYRWEFRLLPGESADGYASVAALRPLIAPWTANADGGQLTLIRVAEYTFRAQLADRWRRGRVFLLGDAAHLTPPFIGQGMGAGLRDAMNLSWKLAGVLNGDLPESVLDSYEQERKPHTRALIRLALTVGRAMTSGGDFGNLVRRAVVPRMHHVPGLRDKVVDSRTPPLRRSAMVLRSRSPRRLTGSLCPNPVLPDGRRLDEAVGGGFALISAAPVTASQRAELERRGAAILVAQPGTDLADWLRGGRAAAAIVRPDRTVMAAGRRVDRLCDAVPPFTAAWSRR
ncbi:bifunctional 3-(3-hydroxy-phenyl)propionate/3-hydroxycinnamic acid hydroxylase [Mycolicibacterium sp. 120270]|uniref:bifunctional 3-(3-hydroxy-phenyl)propionate/3-hydroxycinnamic acid hydroxylase MhpA n=1 Tax=Mycolicibacterium sp. 120270 TaxID=3090600 RepID=UPI00299D123F|nr:bifunctional 3-(3-hydroxy-phenyl)propionate/3-hydroxycinnamic acid hydroxylase [Mycolicibacterium sp. 120270]MDX1886287.1 bifunctional 3-(3-hydroxy-phenyl)propionate/3-hydroxycinnamic acid hydroxylase [Mycolicibacterium sp. 120270]